MRNPQGSAVGFGKTLQCLYSFQISILVHVVFCKQSPTAVLYVYNLLKYKYTNTEVACSKYFTDGVMIFFSKFANPYYMYSQMQSSSSNLSLTLAISDSLSGS